MKLIEIVTIASCVIAAFIYGYRIGRRREKERCLRITGAVHEEGRFSPSAWRIYRSIEDDLPYLVSDATEENEGADYRTSARRPLQAFRKLRHFKWKVSQ